MKMKINPGRCLKASAIALCAALLVTAGPLSGCGAAGKETQVDEEGRAESVLVEESGADAAGEAGSPAGGEEGAAESSAVESAASEQAVSEESVPEESASEQPAPEESVSEQPAPEESASEQAAPEPVRIDPYVLQFANQAQTYTYDIMMNDLNQLAAAYPDLLVLNMIGTTADGRSIPEVILGPIDAPRHVIVQYTMHGREYINTTLCMYQLASYITNIDQVAWNGETYRQLFSDICFHVVPMTNPDGVTISQMGPEGIRSDSLKAVIEQCYQYDVANGFASGDRGTYYRRWKANAMGVDVNRNFDTGWSTYAGHSQPSSERYKGAAPASEPETQAILAIQQQYPVAACISYHSSGSVVYWDYGSSGDIYNADAALASMVSTLTGYPRSSTISSSQDSAGCSDYFVLVLGIPAVTIENGYGTCPLDMSQMQTIINANQSIWPAVAGTYG